MPRCCRCGASDYSMTHSCPYESSLPRTQVTPIRQSPRRVPFLPNPQRLQPFSPEYSPSSSTDESFLPSETSCLQDLLRHTCNYAQKMEERIVERVHQESKVSGDCMPQFCAELEKDLLFTEMTSKTTDYYRGMVRDRMSTRRYTLDKTEQDLCQGFNRVISLLRKMEKCDEFCKVINELQSVRAQVRVLTVAAERYGATTSEIRFLNDLEKVIRCIECIDKHHEQTSCELKKLRMMNDELCNMAADTHVTDSAVQCFVQEVCQSSREQKSTCTLPPCTSSVACQATCRAPSPPCPPPTPPQPCAPSSMIETQPCPYLGEVMSMADCETASFAQSICSKEQVCCSASQGSLPYDPCDPCSPVVHARASTPVCSSSRPPTKDKDRGREMKRQYESPGGPQREQRSSRSVDDYQTVCTEPILSYSAQVCPEPSNSTGLNEIPPCPLDGNQKRSMDLLERLFYIGLLLLGAAALLFLAFHLFSLWQRMRTSEEDQAALCEPCSPVCLDDMDCYCQRETPPPPPPEEPFPEPEGLSTDEHCGPACHFYNFFQNIHNVL